ncbi:MAG TPA: hypothetical protein VK590_04020, partial [Saprospiraceae bacterium]|nr:hypothetical protein [Saprospiraceae bacterium]
MVKFILTVQLCLIAISSFAQPKPIAFYPLNGNANDLSGNGFNGIVSGAIPTIDRCGKANSAYYFDGIDDVITIADNNILDIGTQDYTIVAWIKTNAEDWGRIVSKGSSSC